MELKAEVDRDAISQLVVNLLSNAEKYASDGGEFSVSLLRTKREDRREFAEIWVEDRGPGIPKGLETKIFEQFFRADESLSSGIQGSGLGLTLARQIARAHGGELHYEHREAGGSRFVVAIPLLPSEPNDHSLSHTES